MSCITLRVPRAPKNPYSIRKKNSNNYWLCANTANPKNWHFANSPGSSGVTEYKTEAEAKKAIKIAKEQNEYLNKINTNLTSLYFFSISSTFILTVISVKLTK